MIKANFSFSELKHSLISLGFLLLVPFFSFKSRRYRAYRFAIVISLLTSLLKNLLSFLAGAHATGTVFKFRKRLFKFFHNILFHKQVCISQPQNNLDPPASDSADKID